MTTEDRNIVAARLAGFRIAIVRGGGGDAMKPHPYTPPEAARAIARSVRPVRWEPWYHLYYSNYWSAFPGEHPHYPRVYRPIAAWRAW